MSGGVDSSAAAWMLQQEGAELVGLFMRNGVKVAAHEVQKKSCCSEAPGFSLLGDHHATARRRH